ncbi:uncharacterized protein LOC126887904 [Diabrotica virgifera virgifera]|uniref:Uncharacterized protein n=1 Tax=Diabrotica virgifera virgifera TaxID=50390 RepID=A0ABM5KNJ7_DIAVI|nr:uncharacterized protein LOC126887904 [Diabrotica virgifera virgifera]
MESIQLGVDLQHTVNQMCLRVWQNLWNRTNLKLHSIQARIPALKIPALCRRDKIVMRRLRIGHCRLTHGYLMSQGNPPWCHTCNTRVTVKHILVECQLYTNTRRQHKLDEDQTAPLSDNSNFNNVIMFLKDSRLYYAI